LRNVYGWVLHSDGINYFDVKPMLCGLLLPNCISREFYTEYMYCRLLLLSWPSIWDHKRMSRKHVLSRWFIIKHIIELYCMPYKSHSHIDWRFDRAVVVCIATGGLVGRYGSS
jgi:hypothetical protein